MKYYLILIFAVFSIKTYAQKLRIIPVDSSGKEILLDTSKWMSKDDINFLKSMKLSYRKSTLFDEEARVECFKDNAFLESILTCVGNQLSSKDKEFIAFIPLYRFLTKDDSTSLNKSFPRMNIPSLDKQHIYQIRANILYSLKKDASINGENSNFDWRKFVNYYSDQDAKNKFNADTAINFLIKLEPKNFYNVKYKYLKALFLQKKGRGFVNFYCFYTDKGKRKLTKYWKGIESIFFYEELIDALKKKSRSRRTLN